MKYEDFPFTYSSRLPSLTDIEYQELKTDIVEKGVLVPIIVAENNEVLDGQHRLKIAKEIGLDINSLPFDIKLGLTDQQKQSVAFDLNLHRRHLTSGQKAILALEVEPLYAEEQEQQRRDKISHFRKTGETVEKIPPSKARDQAAKAVGTNGRYVSDAKRLKQDAPEVFEQVKTGELSIPEAKKKAFETTKPIYASAKELPKVNAILKASEEEGQEYLKDELLQTGNIKRGAKEINRLAKIRARQEKTIELPQNDNVWHGDFREVGQKIPDNSVDLIFTDPPYNEEAIKLYHDLGIFAARVLKPGGICLAYSGQIYLPQVLNALGESLEYIWCLAVKHNGSYTRIFKPKANNAWKPILMYCKPPYEAWWQQIVDLVEDKIDKSDHEWQQSTNAPDYYTKVLCPQNGLVVDPFCGSGTTLLSAKKNGLKFIGIEEDIEDIEKTLRRLNDFGA